MIVTKLQNRQTWYMSSEIIFLFTVSILASNKDFNNKTRKLSDLKGNLETGSAREKKKTGRGNIRYKQTISTNIKDKYYCIGTIIRIKIRIHCFFCSTIEQNYYGELHSYKNG